MCKSNITLKKYLKLICEVLFYNISIAAIFVMTGYGSVKDIINAFLLVRVIDSKSFYSMFFDVLLANTVFKYSTEQYK